MSATRCSRHRSRRSTAAHSRRRGSARFTYRKFRALDARPHLCASHAPGALRLLQLRVRRARLQRARARSASERLPRISQRSSPAASAVRRRARSHGESSRCCSLRATERAVARSRSAARRGAYTCCWGEAIGGCTSSRSAPQGCGAKSIARYARCATRLRREVFWRRATCGNSRK